MINKHLIKIAVAFLVTSLLASPAVAGEASFIVVPGNMADLCYYSNFFYNFPSEDFIYYLNDRLLFTEAPDGRLEKDRLRLPLLGLIRRHRTVKEFFHSLTKDKWNRVVLDLQSPTGFADAVKLLELMGRKLVKRSDNRYSLKQIPMQDADYFHFTRIRPATLLQQMDRTHKFVFQLKETQMPFPWKMEFFNKVSGLKLDETSFLETLVQNERMSVLVGTLYRLSNQEIDYITRLNTDAPFESWRKIYMDRKFLMGLFLLSHSLRVDPVTQRLLLPGGDAAEGFWASMAQTGPEVEASVASATSVASVSVAPEFNPGNATDATSGSNATDVTDATGGTVGKISADKTGKTKKRSKRSLPIIEGNPFENVDPSGNIKTTQAVIFRSPGLKLLRQLALADEGKLNLLYTFSFFLPEAVRKELFFNYDAAAFKKLYRLINLDISEKVTENKFPRLNEWNFFTMAYALKSKEGRIFFPGGPFAWQQALQNKDATLAGPVPSIDMGDVLQVLMLQEKGVQKNSRFMTPLRKFMALYSKFSSRPQLLTQGALQVLYRHYDQFNGLVDYIEKIPLKNPQTVHRLFSWVQQLERLGSKEKELFTAIYQSFFEVLSFAGRYAPQAYDYDQLVGEVINLPLLKGTFFPRFLDYLEKFLGVTEQGRNLEDVALSGVQNPLIRMDGASYQYMIKTQLKQNLDAIRLSQEGWRLAQLYRLKRLLTQGTEAKPPYTADICAEIEDAFSGLKQAEIGDKAPADIRKRVTPYSRKQLMKQVKALTARIHKAEPLLTQARDSIYGDFLIYQLKENLMILAYALNIKDPEFKMLLNPNLVRFHYLDGRRGKSLWDNFGTYKSTDPLSNYHLEGALSRLNVTLAPQWEFSWLRQNVLHNQAHVQALLVNLMQFYPEPGAAASLQYNGFLTDLGLKLLKPKCPSEVLQQSDDRFESDEPDSADSDADESVESEFGKEPEVLPMDVEVRRLVMTRLSGYGYRKAIAYAEGRAQRHGQFFSRLRQLGAAYVQANPMKISADDSLPASVRESFGQQLKPQGASYFHTYGNLVPQEMNLFPQELTPFIAGGWLSGAMVDEFKYKTAHHFYKKKMPAQLIGQIMYMYFADTGRKYLRQNHEFDFPISYFVFDLFNNGHLNRYVKQLKKSGFLHLN